MYKCKQCEKQFNNPQQLGGHMTALIKNGKHNPNKKRKEKKEYEKINNLFKCPYCAGLFSNHGIGTHVWRQHGEGQNHNPHIGYTDGTKQIWNKNLTAETSDSVNRGKETLKKRYANGEIVPAFLGRKHTEETKKKMKANCGGYRKGSGRGKSGWYKGFWCDSTWELAWVIFNIDHDIKFERNTQGFNYVHENKIKKYYPDFLSDDVYIEIKGYMTIKDNCKINQFPYNIQILEKLEMQKYLDYAINKYGVLKKLYDLKD